MNDAPRAGAGASLRGRPETGAVEVATAPPYTVAVGAGVLARLPATLAALEPSRVAVVTDATVDALYGERLDGLAWGDAPPPRRAVGPGEDAKRLTVLEDVLDFLAEQDLDRAGIVVALGGGVVGDLAGLAASLYMRGVRVVQCPTTLLAMVDSSVGGKTAVNLRAGKNLAGTFHQPSAVLADVELLRTLPAAELASGLGEVVKTALVGDPALLEELDARGDEIRAGDPAVLTALVTRCVRVKAEVVASDTLETGRRKALNLGHTFAHALELVAGYGTIPHGIAVGTGLGLAARAAEAAGLLDDPGLPDALEACLERVGLPPTLADLRARTGLALRPDELLAGLRHDKKGRAGEPAFVLPRRAGRLALDQRLEDALLAELLA